MGSRVIAAALALILGAGVLTGCGSSGSGSLRSATIKLDYAGQSAWVVVGVPGHQKALAAEILQGVQSAGASGSLTASKPQGPLDCGHDIKIGHGRTVFQAIRQYTGKTASVKVYGSSPFASGVCRGLLAGFGGG